MPKLAFKPAPTFKAKVGIPVPGAGEEKVQFTFKHRTKAELADWLSRPEDADGKEDAALVLEMVAGWEFEEPLDTEHVAEFLQNYHGAGIALYRAYIEELQGARRGN